MSVDFTGQKIKLTYASLLHLDPASTGISVNFEQVYDGDGTPSALYVSSTSIKVGKVILSDQYVQMNDAASSDYVRLSSPTDITTSYTITFPATGPAGNNYVLEADSSGNLSWIPTPGGGGGSTDSFKTISVAGQSDIVAESSTDTLTIDAGSGITLTTDASTDTLTITSSITQYTDENAQDAVGAMVDDSTFVNLTYTDATPSLVASLSATGTPDNTKFLRGDNTWAVPAGSGSGLNSIQNQSQGGSSVLDDTNSTVTDLYFNQIVGGTGITVTGGGNNTAVTIDSDITQYTDEMSQDATASLIQNGTGISWSYNDVANTLTPTVTLAPFSTTNLSEGTNLYYTTARFDTAFSGKTTTDLAEGTNLYFTDERAQDAVGGALVDGTTIDFTYSDVSNTITAEVATGSITSSYVDSTITTAAFNTIAVSGQSDVVADSAADTLTLAAGSNITITTNATTDTITIAASGSSYTDEEAQDAVGSMVANSTFVNLAYVDATPSLTASLSATGTPDNTKFLRGDNTWSAPTATVDINGTTEYTDPDYDADFLLAYDASATANRKISLLNAFNLYGMGYVSGTYYAATGIGHVVSNTTTTGQATGTLYFYPFYCHSKATFTTISMRTVTGVAGGNLNMGIYNNDYSTNKPTGNPITNSTSGSLSIASGNTVISHTFSSAITLTPGIYWLAFSTSNSTASFTGNNSLTNGYEAGPHGLGFTTWAASITPVVGYTQSFVYSATLPTVGTLTERAGNSNVQLIALSF